jgi:hypothetical protein
MKRANEPMILLSNKRLRIGTSLFILIRGAKSTRGTMFFGLITK